MPALAHIRSGQLIRQYRPSPDGAYRGWVDLENGQRTSPPVDGMVNGNDKIVPVVEETQDTSTGPDTVKSDSGYQVEANRVYRLISIRDMTAQEIADRLLARASNAAGGDLAKLLKLIMSGQFAIVKQLNGGTLTVNQYLNWLDNNPTLDDAVFIEKIRALLEG